MVKIYIYPPLPRGALVINLSSGVRTRNSTLKKSLITLNLSLIILHCISPIGYSLRFLSLCQTKICLQPIFVINPIILSYSVDTIASITALWRYTHTKRRTYIKQRIRVVTLKQRLAQSSDETQQTANIPSAANRSKKAQVKTANYCRNYSQHNDMFASPQMNRQIIIIFVREYK